VKTRQAITRVLMSLLMTATLLWGGCLSCPQYFMLASKAGKSCCMPSGECKEKQSGRQSRSQECTIQPVAVSDSRVADTIAQAATSVMPIPAANVAVPLTLAVPNELRLAQSDRGSPPDLNLLHSILRI